MIRFHFQGGHYFDVNEREVGAGGAGAALDEYARKHGPPLRAEQGSWGVYDEKLDAHRPPLLRYNFGAGSNSDCGEG